MVRGGKEQIRGECVEGPATERSDHDNGERFVTVSSSFHSAHGFKHRCRPQGEKPS